MYVSFNTLTGFIFICRAVLTNRQNIVDHVVGYIPEDSDNTIVQPKGYLPPVNSPQHETGITLPSISTRPSKAVGASPCPSPESVLSGMEASKCSAGASTALPSPQEVTTIQALSPTQISRKLVRDVATNITSDIGHDGELSPKFYGSHTQDPNVIASAASIKDEGFASTPRADHARTNSNATTLRESTSRGGLDALVLHDGEFRRKLQNEYQLLAEIQGQRDRRAMEEDEEGEDQSIDFHTEFQNCEDGKQDALEDQSRTYEALLSKVKQDGEDALNELQDLHDDEMKYLRKELEKVAGRKGLVEKRLKKVLFEQKAIQEDKGALMVKCKALEDGITHKDEQLQYMLSTLQNSQQQLDDLKGQYNATRTETERQNRLLEDKARSIIDMRQAIDILTSQLTPSGQVQQAPDAQLVGSLRNENARLLGVISGLQARNQAQPIQVDHLKQQYSSCAVEASHEGLQYLLRHAEGEIAQLVQAVSEAKREHDSWTDDQLYGLPEEPLGDKTKVANHMAYKDKLYQDLEKRFQDCSAVFEEHQKRASSANKDAIDEIISLRKELRERKAAMDCKEEEKEKYRKESEKVHEMLLSQIHYDEFVEALSYHFDLVREDNCTLVTRVRELEEQIKGLKHEVTGHERKAKNLAKEFNAQNESVRDLEDDKKALESKVDSMTYMAEVAEGCQNEDTKTYKEHINALNSELRMARETLCHLDRSSAPERILWELNYRDAFIAGLKSDLFETQKTLALVSRERDYFHRVSGIDDSLAACYDRNFTLLQRKLRIAEAQVAGLEDEFKNDRPLHVKEAREYKEAWEAEQVRVQELEKELYQLYQNLECKVSYTPQDTPPTATGAEPTEGKHAVLEDLATRLWTRMLGLEDTVRTLGRSIIEPNNERAELRLACAGLLGLHEEEWETPGDTTSDSDGREVEVVSGE